MYHFTDGGLRNVWLANGYRIKNTPYGETVAIQNIDGLVAAIASALIRKKSTLGGTEFRYIRTAMLMSQAALGKALGRTEQAVAIWEKSGHIPKYADSLIRVLYALQANGDEKIKNIIHAINDSERTIQLIMKETPKGWSSKESSKGELHLTE
ncbi:DNA-binding transcriptional regulator YiaG [Collimonas sp. PA-H2]|uniref:helix-turn-helix domain-containing protein n=1 Tax=Collimonas sp. PA-H2 TaxID=1881062 RepID=UPI000BF85ACB|nr:hypothetical protein [Collimonas sp. PA-H2]PFH09707.1 DNA-binding transcriptional regulator YiaG [Collimonas sp. PA-H2]